MEVDFKFSVGQWVYLRGELRLWRERYAPMLKESKRDYVSIGEIATLEHKPAAILVVERHMQECYGGIQLHYHFRNDRGTVAFTERELTDDFNDTSIGIA